MGRLVFEDGSEHTLDPRAATTLGRASDAVIRIQDSSVDELHCVIRALKGGGFGLKDLGGSPTAVNEREVQAVRLQDGDTIRVGEHRLRFVDGQNSTPQASQSQEPSASSNSSAAIAEEPASPAHDAGTGESAQSTGNEAAASGSASSSPVDDDFVIGSQLGGYEIQGVMGHGGMGTVYRAMQLSLGREVAIKVLKPELAADPSFVQRFVSEARAAGRFNHPNVVQVFDVDDEAGHFFYSMELLPGGSLEDRLRQAGPLDIDEVLLAMRDAAAGLSYAEQLGVVHHDIKPDNLMPGAQGAVKICDLGLAGEPKGGEQGRVLGTPHFISPEQIRGEATDTRSDLYSLGCSVWRLLVGKNPFQGKTVREILKKHLEAERPHLREQRADIPEEVDRIVARLMERDPGDRYASAAELVAEIDGYLEARSASGRGLKVLVGVALVALIGVVIWFATRDDKIVIKNSGDPNAAEAAAKTAREAKAELAYEKVSDDLPPLQRAAAFDAVAKDFDGTKFATRAKREAERIRDAERRRVAAVKAEEARVEALAKRLKSEALALIADPFAAWSKALEVRGNEDAAAVAQAAAEVADRVGTKVQELGKADFAKFETALHAADAAAVPQLQKAFVERWTLGTRRLPTDAEKYLTKLRGDAATRAGERLAAIDAKRREAAQEFLRNRDELVFGDKGCLKRILAGDFDAAVKQLTIEVPAGFEANAQPLQQLRRVLTSAKAAYDRLASQVAQGNGPTVTWLGADFKITALDAGVATLQGDDATKSEKRSIFGNPELALECFAKAWAGKGASKPQAGEAAAIVVCGIAHGLPVARSWLDAVGRDKPSDVTRFPFVLVPSLERMPKSVAKDLLREASAIAALGRLLVAWRDDADAAGELAAGELERLSGTITATMLGVEPKRDDGKGR